MPTTGNLHGQKYVPTPVNLQKTLTDTPDASFLNSSASPILYTSPPVTNTDEKLTTLKRKTGAKSKTTSKNKTDFFASRWTRKKKIIIGAIVAAIIIGIIILAVLLGVLLSRSTSTTTTTTPTATTATIVYWPFSGTTADLNNIYNSTLINGASYFSATTNQPFVGYGGGLNLVSTSSQYVSVLSPFLDLTYKSFTIELWIYPTISSSTDYGLFGQCQCSFCPNQCLYFVIRSSRLYISFMNNDLSGNTTLTSSVWYHVAFVYNYQTNQQILYVNGYQDAIKSSASAYQGTNGTMLIGAAQVYSATTYYNGYLDDFKITTRAKSSTEILNDATLTAYYSFDLPNPTYDNGPLGLNGTANNTAIVSGRVNQAMLFSGLASYFYAYGFYQTAYAVNYARSFSVSLWINPSSFRSCAIVQTAYQPGSGTCFNLLGLYTNYGVTMQIVVQGYAWPTIYGSFITINTWTHISITYSATNGLRLYVNGVYFGTTGAFSFQNSGYIMWLQLGYIVGCSSSTVINNGYPGSIDEVYMHSREITASEVSALANP